MTRMLLVADVADSIKKHQAQIITSLKDPDIRYLGEWLWFLLFNKSDTLSRKVLFDKGGGSGLYCILFSFSSSNNGSNVINGIIFFAYYSKY